MGAEAIPESFEDDPVELIEENRELLELVAESDTAAGVTARRLLAYTDEEESGS